MLIRLPSLSICAERYEEECFDILSDTLRVCCLAGGDLDLARLDLGGLSDHRFYLLDDLRGVDQIESLSLPSKGLSYLLKKQILGLERVQGIEIKAISDQDITLLNEHSDQEYVQDTLNKTHAWCSN